MRRDECQSINRRNVALVLTGLVIFAVAPAPAPASVLTGITHFTLDSNGNLGPERWNTIGGDTDFNLYCYDPGNPTVALNPGDGASTRVSLPLAPGNTYSLILRGEPNRNNPFPDRVGLNLFFNGDDDHPRISAATTTNDNQNIFWPNGGGTNTLPNVYTPGANSLTFNDGDNLVTLTHYNWYPYGSPDYVGMFSATPNGDVDDQGYMQISVQTVPEPGALGLLILTGLVMLNRCRPSGVLNNKNRNACAAAQYIFLR